MTRNQQFTLVVVLVVVVTVLGSVPPPVTATDTVPAESTLGTDQLLGGGPTEEGSSVDDGEIVAATDNETLDDEHTEDDHVEDDHAHTDDGEDTHTDDGEGIHTDGDEDDHVDEDNEDTFEFDDKENEEAHVDEDDDTEDGFTFDDESDDGHTDDNEGDEDGFEFGDEEDHTSSEEDDDTEGSFAFDGDENDFEFDDDDGDDHADEDHKDDDPSHAGEEESKSTQDAVEQPDTGGPNATNGVDSPGSRISVAQATDVEAHDDSVEQVLAVRGKVERSGDTDTFEIDVSAATDAGTTITSVEAAPGTDTAAATASFSDGIVTVSVRDDAGDADKDVTAEVSLVQDTQRATPEPGVTYDVTQYASDATTTVRGTATMRFDRFRKVVSAEDREDPQEDLAKKQQGVNNTKSARAALATDTVSVDRGGIATFPIRIAGQTDSATLTIESGSSDYQADVAVTDGDDDGVVIVQFDTRAAGATDSATPVVWTADAGDAATLRNQVTSDAALSPGGYRIRVAVQSDSIAETTPTDAGVLSIGTRSTDKIRVLTAPGSVTPDADGDGTVEMADLVALDQSGQLSADRTIATTDWAVLQVKASGLEGLVRNRSTFDAAIGDELALVLTRANEESAETNSSTVRLETDNLTANDAVTLVPAPRSDNYFVVIDASRATVTDGRTTTGVAVPDAVYRATFAVTDERLRPDDGDEPKVVQTTFKTVEPAATFGSDTVTVTPAANQTIVGATSMAPGTEITVSVASTNETESKFVREKTVTVGENGRFSATFDFAGQPTGSTLELAASDSRRETLLESTTVRVVSEAQAAAPTTKPEQTGTVASPVSPELSPPLRTRETGSDAEGTVGRVVVPEGATRSAGGTGPVGTVFIPILIGTLVVAFVFVRNRKQ